MTSATSHGEPGKRSRKNDLVFRIAYTRPELSRILPFGLTTLDEMIKKGVFPDGVRPHVGARKIWPRRVVEEWLERSQLRNESRHEKAV